MDLYKKCRNMVEMKTQEHYSATEKIMAKKDYMPLHSIGNRCTLVFYIYMYSLSLP